MADNMKDTEGFTGSIVQVVIAIVIVGAVAIPIVNTILPSDADPTLKTLVGIIPVFLILSVLMIVIKKFMAKE